MPILLNNCRNRPHAAYYPSTDDQVAFYDLDTAGTQAKMAVGITPGTECIVLSRGDKRMVRFQAYKFDREEVRNAPLDETGLLRVFFGKPVRDPVVLRQTQAAASGPYTAFFNDRGHIKRPPVIAV